MITHSHFRPLALLSLFVFGALQAFSQEYRSAASGNWNALGTWQQSNDGGATWGPAASTPTNASGAITILSPHTVTVSDNRSADELMVANGAVLTVSGGTFTIADGTGTDLEVFGTWNVTGGAVSNAGTVQVTSGTFNWNTGTLGGAGTYTVGSGATATFGTTSGKTLNSTFTNNGTINWNGGPISGSGNFQNTNGAAFNIGFTSADQLQVPFTNQAGATVNQNGSGTFNTFYFSTYGVFTNAGTINLVNGNWLSNNTFINSGTIDIPAGRLITFNSSTTTNLNAGTTFTGTGSITSSSSTNQNFPWTNTTHALTISGGAWNNNSGSPLAFGVGSQFNWTGGALAGTGNYTVQNGMTITLSTNQHTLNSVLTNNGTINWGGGAIVGSGNFQNTSGANFNINYSGSDQLQVPFTNQAGAAVNQNGAGTFNTFYFSTYGVFTNAGTINLVNGNWLSNNTFINSGTIDIPAGRLITFNSTTNLNAGTIFTGAGAITSGGITNQNFPWTNTTHALTISGGAWNNSSGSPLVFGVGSQFIWTGGTLAGAGNYSVQNGMTITLSTNQHTLNSVLTNNGTINWNAGNIGGSGNIQNTSSALFNINYNSSDQLQVPFTNQTGATVNQNGTGTFNTYYFSTYGVFTNAGTINLVTGNWRTDNTFTNTGTIDIPAGRMITFNSTTNLNAGTTITGTGSITSSGTTNQSFPWTNTTHALTISNGAWNNSSGSPLVFGVGSQFIWTGGTLAGAGNYSVQNGMTITLSTNQHTLNSVLTNNGTINWNAGNIGGSGNIQNTSSALFNINYNSSDQLQVPFTNQTGASVNQNGNGTFNTYYFSTYGVFTNAGTINLFTGNWLFNNTSIHSATSTITIAASRTLTFNTATTIAGTVSNAGTLAGTITAFTGPSFTNNGSVTLGNLPFAGSSAQTLDGTGSISSLTINNANGVTLGGTQTVTGTLTLTNGRITLGNNDLILSNTALGGLAGTVNATNRIVTNGTGAFHRQIPAGGSNYPFPIGTASSYLPATLSNTSGPAERFGARVQNEVYSEYGAPGVPTGDLVVNDQVERTWVITEATEGGNQATVQLQWNTADEGTNFGRSNCALHTYNGTDWVAGALGAASGSNPYTRSLAGVSGFREFTVADGESNLPFACPGGVTPGSPCDDGSACTTNDVIGVDCQCAGIFQDSDNDGTCNAEDGCPSDVNKTAPGACGCGVADVPASYYVDADGDGYGTGALVPGFFTCVVPPGYAAVNGDCDDANPNAHTDAAPLQPVIAVIGSDFCPGATLQLVTDRSLPVAGPGSGSPYGQSALNTSPSAMPSTTWEAWVYPAATSGVRQTIMSNDDGSFDRTVTLEGSNFGVFTGSGVWQPVAATIGQWQHIAVVFSGNTMRFYKNGTEYVYGSNTNFGTTVALFAVGRNPTAAYANELFNGRIDEVRVWNMARTQAQIQAYRILDIDPSSPGLAALWKMNEKSGNSIPSSVPGNAYPLTFTGTLSTDFPTSFNAGNTYAWSPATGLSAPVARYTSLTVTNAQEYTLNVTTPCGQSAPPASIQIDLSPESTPWFADTDNDGYGNPDSSMQSCTQPSGYVADNTDCDDTNVNIHPGATEACNGIDDNCDGTVDEGVTPITYYADADGDGAGDPAVTATSCTGAPDGFVANYSDQCPTDPLKITQGQCGCGSPDTDSDNDGTADCADGCPNDPLKTAPGQCGCGNADTDTDNDGIADCVDTCPGVSGQIGSACDDGLATTGNDVLDNACECHGQLIDCLGVPGGAALPGAACTVSNLPGIWSASCVCELEGPDVAVQNVSAVNDTIAPDQSITLNWNVANLGNAAATVNWTERYYMESGSGQNRTLIAQAPYTSGTPLTAGASLPRSTVLTMPALINVGDDARFVVELVPGTGLTELPNSAANNTGTQATNWVVRKLLKLLVPQPNLTEGAVAGVPITVQRTGSLTNALTVNIGIDESERFTFPTSITILAGQSARSFTLVATENALLEGTIPAVLTVSSSGFLTATRNLTIIDNESPALSFTGLPATTGEGTTASFQVTTNFAPTQALQVFLTSSAPSRFAVPASVTIAANTTSAPVNVSLPQDALPELDITVNLTAGAAGHTAANASLQLTDDDVPGLELILQTDTVSESGGAFAVQATLRRTAGSPPIAFTAVLTPSLANTLILPATVSLAANVSQQTFTVGVIDNALVDGYRTVTINAAVQMAGCGCSAPPSTVANVNADLTVVDNDGPSLTVTVNPATLAEGLANAGTLRVQRNTSTANVLNVDLSSYDLSEITLPATAVIPIGALYVDVPITTVNDGTPDGSQQVYVQAAASGFAPGIAWCIVTDVNQPDLVVTALSASASPWPALTPITWQATIGNTGFANSIVGTPVRGVLSQNNIVDAGDIVLFDYTINTPVVAGGNVQISGAAVVPNNPGAHKLLIQVNPGASVSELTYTNNTSQPLNVSINPSYTATAQVAGTTFLRGTTIPVTGTAVRPDMSPAANEPIEVYVLTNGLRREVLTTTNAVGAFAASFLPLANESGHYTIGASFPGMGQTTEQDAFDIHGVRLNNGQYPQFVVLIGDTLSGTLAVQNMSDATLTNLTLVPTNVPAGATFSFGSLATLAGGATENISFDVSGTFLTPGFNYAAATLNVVSDQGTIQPQDTYYYCQVPGGHISADISSITTSVSQAEGQQLVQFRVMNNGAGSTGALSLSLPSVPWLTAMTPVNMPALPPGDTALVILRFQAHASVPFDAPINGTIAINGANSNSLVLPFTFTKVSTTVGDLTVDAVNQFTFFDEDEPHVAGATVEVRHQYTNALLASGVTDANGLFSMTGLPEGTHRLVVSKPQHLPTEQLVTVNPGTSVTQTVFIQYQAITFGWTVVPTTVQDQYDVQLNMVFETNVPIPVVTIDMPDTMPQLFGNEVYAFNVTLTNHGLITAEEVTLYLPQNDPEYEFITNYIPTSINALQSIQVPVLMRLREEPIEGSFQLDVDAISELLRMDGPAPNEPVCKEKVVIFWKYHCNEQTGIWERNGVLFSFLNRVCESTGGGLLSGVGFNPSVFGNGFPECPFCPDPISTAGFTHPDSVRLIYNKNCKECEADLAAALGDCAFGPLLDAIKGAVEGADDVLDVLGALNDHWNVVELPDPLGDIRRNACVESYGTQNPGRCSPPKMKPDPGCIDGAIAAALGCSNLINTGGSSFASRKEREVLPQALLESILHLQVANEAYMYRDSIGMEYYGVLFEEDAMMDLRDLVSVNIENLTPIGPSQRSDIQETLAGVSLGSTQLDAFIDRWNLSLLALGDGIHSPNTQYPGMINWTKIDLYQSQLDSTISLAGDLGYNSVWDYFAHAFVDVMEVLLTESNAVCASVTVQLSQTVTMTREAFTGTLDIFNGHPTDGIDSLSVNILITDPDGVPSNGLFQINTEQLTGLSDVTGTGQIPSQEHGIVQFLFIPEPGAAPTVSVPYGFGGSVTYWDPYNQEMTTIELAPITLTVNPSPDLVLHYFMQRNILGDDALTSPDVEPSIPAELAVMIENHGYGAAQNMKISSAQPEIVENESGLAINFELIGSNLQGQPANLGVLDIPFGNIPPQQTKVGQWWFTSSLLGKFVSYEASVVHANSFGNPELSLIQGVELHELTRSIREYGPQGDGMNDFLVNDQFDIHDVPDIIYFSQGIRTAEVLPAESGSFNAPVNAPTFTNTLTVTASEPGWNYIKLDDPGNGDYDIVSVTRQDNQAIPLANAWLTFVTLPVSQQPVYEDKFHFVDTLASTSPTSYSVVWVPKNTDVPAVDTIVGAPTAISAVQVTQLTVVFDKAIDPATFTVNDLTLTFQGGPDLISNAATITQVDPFTFTVDLTALTTGDGLYVFTAQAAGVTDLYGINGVAGRQVSWTQFISVPAIIAFQGLPNGTTDDSFTTIELLFNRPIDETSLTAADLSLLLGGSPQAGALTVTRMNSDSTLFLVSGLESMMSADGAYTLGVDMPNVLSTEGVAGLQAQSVVLTLDGTGPTVAELTPITTGGLDAQHRTGVNIRFSEPVADLTIGAITFTRGGNPLPLLPAQLSQVDADEWRVTGFGMSSYPDGEYAFTASAAGLTDAVGNVGSGSLAANWTVDRSTPITVTNVGISPDLGISSTDGLTSTLSFNTLFSLSEPAAQVTVAQTSFGTENVLATLQNVAAGAQNVPVNFPTGGNTGLKVTAIGSNGGTANGTKNLFIDLTPLSATWQTATNQSLSSTLDAATLGFSAELLDPGAIAAALTLKKDGQPVSTEGLSINPASGTSYNITGLATAASGPGQYELLVDAAQLHKASSGITGNGTATLAWTVVPDYAATLRARVFLEGPYSNGLMHDSLRTLPDFPLAEPFSALGYEHVGGGGETADPAVLTVQGNEAIVDWVLVELRDADDNSVVVASRSALLQRDGDVVATDGFSPITFSLGAGGYHIAIRHRNHLGAMTADTARFRSGVTQADLTLLSTSLYGSQAQKQVGARCVLWAGDVTFDNVVQYVGASNDRDPILVAIGGSTPTATTSGYHNADVNLDGRVKYVGASNDRDPILVNIGGSTPTNIREGQLPQP